MIIGTFLSIVKLFGKMNEKAIKKYFAAITYHTKNKAYILSTLSWFETEDELKEMIGILNQSEKMSVSEIELTIIEKIVEKRKRINLNKKGNQV